MKVLLFKVYTNCSCLPSNITVAYDGGCDQSCNAMGYFLAIMFVLIVFTFFNNIPAITVILRYVTKTRKIVDGIEKRWRLSLFI